jgi:hypothetical protein
MTREQALMRKVRLTVLFVFAFSVMNAFSDVVLPDFWDRMTAVVVLVAYGLSGASIGKRESDD